MKFNFEIKLKSSIGTVTRSNLFEIYSKFIELYITWHVGGGFELVTVLAVKTVRCLQLHNQIEKIIVRICNRVHGCFDFNVWV